ncbi:MULTISPECIES: disulfide oxidoreductase [Shouchella]|uniref:Probable disulfide formation protein n=1 Tax=Alkalicoccobacillus plakortidis TaxID=444060 RepID=A0A9D5I3G9_9BACI|nr:MULTISPECIES: disulfide oxidoreductase [Bacillaceae]KQL58925.1 disulfide bond formation protein DsbB [Alkalicoccobacillus plakortidis]MBG9785436.1 disulfide bond formation protein DsbB [Shouchella lehensis]
MSKKIENSLLFAWLVSFVATLGSLYFSEIKGFEPCALCWYQRIFMYPLVLLIGVGIIRKDTGVAIYSAILSGIGMVISIYHYAIQKLPVNEDDVLGCGLVSCSGEYINWLGFITIPFLAGTAFILIFSTSLYTIKKRKEEVA